MSQSNSSYDQGHRREIWEQNLAFIDKHNEEAASGQHTFTMGINEYADWTSDEFVRHMNGLNDTAEDLQTGHVEDFDWVKETPNEVNWVNEVWRFLLKIVLLY